MIMPETQWLRKLNLTKKKEPVRLWLSREFEQKINKNEDGLLERQCARISIIDHVRKYMARKVLLIEVKEESYDDYGIIQSLNSQRKTDREIDYLKGSAMVLRIQSKTGQEGEREKKFVEGLLAKLNRKSTTLKE